MITLLHLRPRTHHKLHTVERASRCVCVCLKIGCHPTHAHHTTHSAHTSASQTPTRPHIHANSAHYVATILAVNDPTSVVAVTAPAASEAVVATDDLQLHHSTELACLLLQAEETQQHNGVGSVAVCVCTTMQMVVRDMPNRSPQCSTAVGIYNCF